MLLTGLKRKKILLGWYIAKFDMQAFSVVRRLKIGDVLRARCLGMPLDTFVSVTFKFPFVVRIVDS